MHRKMALAAGLGTALVVAIPMGLLPDFAQVPGNLLHYAGWPVALVQLGAIAAGCLVWRLAYRHFIERSLMVSSSPS